MDFPSALKELLVGDASAIRRTSWDHGIVVYIEKPNHATIFTEPFLCMRTWKDGEKTKMIPFEPGHASIFATDWETEHNFSA